MSRALKSLLSVAVVCFFSAVSAQFDTYPTFDYGFCNESGNTQLNYTVSSISECWSNCSALLGNRSELAGADYYDVENDDDEYTNWYDGTQCFCAPACVCRAGVGLYNGTLMVPQNSSLPGECSSEPTPSGGTAPTQSFLSPFLVVLTFLTTMMMMLI